MAASSAVADIALVQQKLIPMPKRFVERSGHDERPPVVRTEVHAMHTGQGMRSMRRRIPPASGFALELLGHAIEYLADEYAHAPSSLSNAGLPTNPRTDPRVEAMQVLMAANRQVYYACPVIPSFWERLASRLLVLSFFARLILSGHGDRTQRAEARYRSGVAGGQS